MSKSTEIQSICVVTPTYNEAKNITKALTRIFKEAARFNKKHEPVETHVLVVDDSSPDGTAQLVKEFQKKNDHVHLLVRKEKEGLGAAYVAGIQHALKTIKPDAIFEMDADLSHDAKDLFRLLQALRDGADFALGSRYVKGGSIAGDWGLHRRITSKLANVATKVLLGIYDVKDLSGGFRGIRSELLNKLDWDKITVKGYAFQAVLLEECLHRGASVKEVPIHFEDRIHGESKMRVKDMVEPLFVYAGIRARRTKEWLSGSRTGGIAL